MKVLINTCIIALILACSPPKSNTSVDNEYVIGKVELQNKPTSLDTTKQIQLMDSVVLIHLSDDISFFWNNQSHSIVEDSLFSSVVSVFRKNQQSIIVMITDTTKTPAMACSIDRNLLIGDLTFLVIDKIKKLPYFMVFSVQWDVLNVECQYPDGMFDYINNYRDEVKQKLYSYLDTKE